jgi:hypothetical protein
MPTGGRSRRDTANQSTARQRVADKRRCFHCGRRNALSAPRSHPSGRGQFRVCLHADCQAETGTRSDGQGSVETYRIPGQPRCPHGCGPLQTADDGYICPSCEDEWDAELFAAAPEVQA